MNTETYKDIEKLEAELWEAADNLRANSKLTSSEYCMPVLGVIFLRHASNRYDDALAAIQADQAAELEHRSVASMLEMLIRSHAEQRGLSVAQPEKTKKKP